MEVNKRIAILGLGKTGLSSYNHYVNKGHQVIAWDDNPKVINTFSLSHNLVNYLEWNFKDLDFIIVSPGIALEYPKIHYILEKSKECNVPIYCDIELFIQENPQIKYIAITGTNGKSTVTALVQHIFLQANQKCIYGGNIGTPVFEIDTQALDYIILELSSYQLELMKNIHFNCAVLLNIQEDHLDHHGNFHNYKKVKYKIFEKQTTKDISILPQSIYKEISDKITGQCITLNESKDIGIYLSSEGIYDNYFSNHKEIIKYVDITYLKGNHNYQNIAFAYAVAKFFEISEEEIISAVKSFKGLNHRQQQLGYKKNILFVNDSKATNQESTVQALKSYENIFLILGGLAKSDNLDIILPFFHKVEHSFLIGSSTDMFEKILKDNNMEYIVCKNLEEATKKAYDKAKEKGQGTVLLSPACASFDQFKSFEERGNVFVEIVKNLQE